MIRIHSSRSIQKWHLSSKQCISRPITRAYGTAATSFSEPDRGSASAVRLFGPSSTTCDVSVALVANELNTFPISKTETVTCHFGKEGGVICQFQGANPASSRNSPSRLRRSESRSMSPSRMQRSDSRSRSPSRMRRSDSRSRSPSRMRRSDSRSRSPSRIRRLDSRSRSPSRSRKSHFRTWRSDSRSKRLYPRTQRSSSRSTRSRSQSSCHRYYSRSSHRARSRSLSSSHRYYSRLSHRSHSKSSHGSHSRSSHRSRSISSHRSCSIASHRSRSRSQSRSRRYYSRHCTCRSNSRSHSRSRKRTRSHSGSNRSHSRVFNHPGQTFLQCSPQDKLPIAALGTVLSAITAPPITIITNPPTTTVVPVSSLPTDSKQQELAKKHAEVQYIGNIRAPFALAPTPTPGLVFPSATRKTPNQIALEAPVPAKPLEQLYPVSAGLQHGGDTGVAVQSFAVGELVAKRLEAAVRLQINPMDTVAVQTLAEVEVEASQWCKSLVNPGQFTGAKVVRPMSMKDHNTGHQAWAKKSTFKNLAPVAAGFGLKMLKKMGWEEGCPLGRSGRGIVEPIVVEVKMDRLGLGTGDMFTAKSLLGKGGGSKAITHYQGLGTGKGGGSKATTHYQGLGTGDTFTPKVPKVNNRHASKAAKRLQGKHPVCVLQEVCVKKHWGVPNYQLVHCAGSARIIQVSIGAVGTFKPALPSRNMKQAKVEAALAALHGMGIMGPEGQWIL